MTPPRLATVSVIRNEADIIETFVRHHAGVASRMVFVLHRCVDNTHEILERLQAEGFPVEIHEETDPGYPKPEVLGERIARLVAENAAEWIVPLHADEFLTAGGGDNVGNALATLTTDRVYTLARKTYVPTPEDDATESNPVKRIVQRRTPESSPERGVLIPASLLKITPWKLSADRRNVVRSETGEALPTLASAAISIAHFPIRTPEQFTGKILGGWVALAGNPGADPRLKVKGHGLVERCTSGRPLSLGELRNLALRYGMPEGALAIPGLVYDAVPTPTHRPQFLVRTAHPIAVLMDSAIASAQSAGRTRNTPTKGSPLQTLLVPFMNAIDRLREALEEGKGDRHVPRETQAENDATACALLLLSTVASRSEPLTGSALTRRQKLGSLLTGLPPEWQWTAAMLQENKLPFSLESAIQELVQVLQAGDYAALRQECRKESASDDIVLAFSQHLTRDLRPPVPATLGTFLAQAAHTLLMKDADVALGLVDPRVQVIHLEAGRGELACEILRRMVNAGIERGANPDVLRRDIVNRTMMQESSSMLRSILAVRVNVLLHTLRMPLGEGESLPIRATVPDATLKMNGIPVICTTISEDDSRALPSDAEGILQKYLRVPLRGGMERDATMSPGLRGIARVHALLKTAETGLGAIIAPRSLLHAFVGSGMRETLLEDFERIRIVDLHGNTTKTSDDEPLDGADRSGTCVLFLVRAPRAAQKTLFMEWKGLKLQKYHALLSRGILDLPWKVIAPEKPGYVFLGQ